MAFKLTKAQREERDRLADRIDERRGKAEDALATAVAAFQAALKDDVLPEIDLYNQAVDEARAWAEDVRDGFQEAFDERSERWQDSEAGQAAAEFVEAWTAVVDGLETAQPPAFDAVEVEWPDVDLRDAPDEDA